MQRSSCIANFAASIQVDADDRVLGTLASPQRTVTVHNRTCSVHNRKHHTTVHDQVAKLNQICSTPPCTNREGASQQLLLELDTQEQDYEQANLQMNTHADETIAKQRSVLYINLAPGDVILCGLGTASIAASTWHDLTANTLRIVSSSMTCTCIVIVLWVSIGHDMAFWHNQPMWPNSNHSKLKLV